MGSLIGDSGTVLAIEYVRRMPTGDLFNVKPDVAYNCLPLFKLSFNDIAWYSKRL